MTGQEAATMRGPELHLAGSARRPKRPADLIREAVLALTIRTLGRVIELAPSAQRSAFGRGCERAPDAAVEPS
jgi:hypothetical protein